MQPDAQSLPESAQVLTAIKVGQAFVDPTRLTTKAAFLCRGGPTNYYFANGRVGSFKYGVIPGVSEAAFVTDVKGYIDELKLQIAQGHPIIFQIEGMETITEEQLDPLDAVKKAAVAAYKEHLMKEATSEEAKALLNKLGVGTPSPSFTPAVPILQGIQTSAGVHQGMAESTSPVQLPPIEVDSLANAGAAVETNAVSTPSINFGGLAKS